MPEIETALAGIRTSTAGLLSALESSGWSDADVRAPSLCEGWTRGHVLTHVARNADGIAATLTGALRGEIVQRYPDGWDARNAAIDAGSGRPLAELAADVRDSAARLDEALAAVATEDGWGLETDQGHPAKFWLLARWTEVEIHHVDLSGAHGPDRWPAPLVAAVMQREIVLLPRRAHGPLLVEIAEDGSAVPGLAGRHWSVGEGERTVVRGPDWAVLAWLVGRPQVVADVLTATPELAPYR